LSDSLFGSPEALMRRTAQTNLMAIWDFCKTEITRLNGLLDTLNEESQEYRMSSFSKLKQIVMSINEDYVNEENPEIFEDSIQSLNKSFKKLCCAYLIPNGIAGTPDNVEDLTTAFFTQIQHRLHRDKLCNYGGIVKLVRFVRNSVEHEEANKPVDLITKKNSYGNIFTLTSILVLSLHAQMEMLNFWLEVEQTA
jgi:hypothetical protein